MKRLNDPVAPLGNFVASGMLRPGRKLGPVLWQLPPNFHFDRDKLDAFFRLLPRDTNAAAAMLGRRHDHRLKARAWLRTGPRRQRLRHALEVRHKSFCDPAFIESPAPARHRPGLRRHGRLAAADGSHVRLRLLPPARLARALSQRLQRRPSSAAGPGASAPGATASRCATGPSSAPPAKAMPRDVYVYFDNTDKLMAPRDAQALMRRLEEA